MIRAFYALTGDSPMADADQAVWASVFNRMYPTLGVAKQTNRLLPYHSAHRVSFDLTGLGYDVPMIGIDSDFTNRDPVSLSEFAWLYGPHGHRFIAYAVDLEKFTVRQIWHTKATLHHTPYALQRLT